VTHRFLLTILLAAVATAAPAQNNAAAAPQPVSRTSYMQRIDNGFVAADADKDGFLERAEIEAAETRVLTARKAALLKQREAAFRRMDTNKDGSLSLAEYNAPLANAAIPKANAAPVLDRLDANKDGKVSLAENRAPAIAQFDRADTNKDGTLSVDEQRAMARR
jgi:Ca2+-binding EF-hand superfamily protein